ncbi:EF-P beta-lysylation protein EpmB [Marinobacter sp. LV10R510-11A]|uniref:EF-P beta-lysylation protein EpmB n=1 Tax=Marinobacter sp. LV10R510-11A TaxID=1415568 RepID=UPI000BB8A6D8|nr:EF-P beta-lysylation protein EpmB [Marinobacter sp. LV10R510-11A]SOB78357.1 EF-P beta-lysylation protein EpmB [Marinobacter sp. LV10R510-11A]
MIQRSPAHIEAQLSDDDNRSWQQLLSDSITSPQELLARLDLPADKWLAGAEAGHRLFQTRVPEPFLARMEKGNAADPLLRQVLPLNLETGAAEGFVTDPLEEDGAIVTTGLIRKYRSRALLMVTGQCAINCRYCFRRHFPYDEQRLGPADRQRVLDTLAASPEINEVIFSGGDPLAVSDQLLSQWASAISNIPHIRRIRLHTRLPVVIPQRVCDALLKWISSTPVPVVMVLHVNHPAEIDHATRRALNRLRSAGVTLLNQSVILRGVNDNADVLENLSETLFEAGVLPYYLHAFDPVAGAQHFDVPDKEALLLVQELLSRLPGFLVPRLVREIPGKPAKTPIDLFSNDL